MKKFLVLIIVVIILILASALYPKHYLTDKLFGYKYAEIEIVEEIGWIESKHQFEKLPKYNYADLNFNIVNAKIGNTKLILIANDIHQPILSNLPLNVYVAKIKDKKILVGTRSDFINGREIVKIKYKGEINSTK